MKKKTNILSIIMIALFAMLLLGRTKVNAAEVDEEEITEEYIQSMLDVLPDEIEIDISEIEAADKNYEIVSNMVGMKVKAFLEEQGFNLEEQGVSISSQAYTTNTCTKVEDFYMAHISISKQDDSINYRKTIKIVYNNSDSRSLFNEQSVKNLELPTPKYFIIKGYITGDYNRFVGFHNDFADYYENIANDETLAFFIEQQAGSSNLFSNVHFHSNRFTLEIFKNGILYDVREISSAYGVTQITISSDIDDTEEAYIKYATPLIKEYIKKFNDRLNADNITLSKGATLLNGGEDTGIEIEDGYTIWNEGEVFGNVILKKDEPETIKKEDISTGIKLDATSNVISGNIVLSSIKVTEHGILNTVKTALERISDKYTVYDINLLENNVKIQPNGKVKISIPIPSDYNKQRLAVYRIESDEEKTEYAITVEEGYATFETNHFSTYVLAEKQENDTSDNETKKEEASDIKKAEVPNTGDITNITVLLALALTGAVIIFAVKKKTVLN